MTAAAVIALGRLSLAFGRVDRITFHEDGVTPESDTDHTVMLGLVASALAAREHDLDVGLVAQFALVHDLVEVYAGDTPTLRALPAHAKAAKKAREHAAFQRIVAEFADLPWLPATLAAYEAQTIREARYVRALDKLLPKVTHLSNRCSTLRAQGVGYDELAARYELQEKELLEYAADFPSVMALRADLVGRVLAIYRPRCSECRCDPVQCETDSSGEHCSDQSCPTCLDGCPLEFGSCLVCGVTSCA